MIRKIENSNFLEKYEWVQLIGNWKPNIKIRAILIDMKTLLSLVIENLGLDYNTLITVVRG